MIKDSEKGYGKKRLRNKIRKYINKDGTIPKMKGLPKTHKEEIGIRQLVNGRGSVLEELKEEMAKVFKVVEIRQKKKKTEKQWRVSGRLERCVLRGRRN